MARRLGKIKSCKNLAKFHAKFWQDNVRQEIAKTSYINLAKFLARFWQDHARQSRQEIAKTCYKILHTCPRLPIQVLGSYTGHINWDPPESYTTAHKEDPIVLPTVRDPPL